MEKEFAGFNGKGLYDDLHDGWRWVWYCFEKLAGWLDSTKYMGGTT